MKNFRLFLLVFLSALAYQEYAIAQSIENLKPAPINETQLKNGLNVTYYYQMFNDIETLEQEQGGSKGKPIGNIDSPTPSGNVLTSDKNMGVGAHITGFIKFDKKGNYLLTILSNDGIKLTVGDKLVYENPYVHADEKSNPITLKIDEPGWYDLKTFYFQKKGTSALQFSWVEPNSTEQKIIPAEFFAHLE
ncbi:MAG: hypothetical protein K1X44_02580 [Alphaproteobacteria bacterium]|nr:hypothetical protein [Alphaproteobacteria bacterium]